MSMFPNITRKCPPLIISIQCNQRFFGSEMDYPSTPKKEDNTTISKKLNPIGATQKEFTLISSGDFNLPTRRYD
ncbi:hypothetical protein JTB14_035271 [Gonioctena quinquepunctata]|nr:hypothetical protein JTB14_035271 [Gonioctena quinquepunctata]